MFASDDVRRNIIHRQRDAAYFQNKNQCSMPSKCQTSDMENEEHEKNEEDEKKTNKKKVYIYKFILMKIEKEDDHKRHLAENCDGSLHVRDS